MYYKTFTVSSRKCPADCRLCTEACAKSSDPSNSGVRRISLPELEVETVHACNQCSNPECVAICPAGALTLNDSGTISLDPGRCIGCGLCSMACTHGGIVMKAAERKASKADITDATVEACPINKIEAVDVQQMMDQLKPDIMTHGTTYCPGCLMEFLVRFTMRIIGKENVVLCGSPACCILGGRVDVAHYGCLMTNGSSGLTGLSRYYRKVGKDVTCVGIFGDGATTDIAFGVLSAASERNEHFLYICYDNEAYMNTGIQRSGSTPQFGWTTTTHVGSYARGKKQEPKYVPLQIALHKTPYVATASLMDLDDYAKKLRNGLEASKHGVAFIHVLTPCPTGWKSDPSDVFELSRLAVETDYAPLWEARYGYFRMTKENPNRRPISDFTKKMGRLKHLNETELAATQKAIDNRANRIRKMAEAFPLTDDLDIEELENL